MQQLNFSNARSTLAQRSLNARSTLAQRSLNARSTLVIFCSLVVLFSNSGCKKKNNPVVATGVSISQKTATIAVGTTLPLSATLTPANTINKNIAYTSSNANVASVGANITGDSTVVTALAEGAATITATTTDGSNLTDTLHITVIKLDPTDARLGTLTLVTDTTNLPLTPIFSSDTVGYTATAPAGSTNINITATAIQPDATMTINGATANNNTAIPLTLTTTATGAIATATIVVTAGNGTTTKTYSIRIGVGREAPSNDASLTNFLVDGISLTAGTPTSISNTLRVWGADGSGTATTSYTLATGATITSTPANPKPSDFASSNGVIYTVTAEDGKAIKNYTYKIAIASYSDGTTAKPYGIYTPAQLSDVNNALTASYKLMNNIALTGNWTPIGGTGVASGYAGTFDGNSKVISNLSISSSDVAIATIGLFRTIGTDGNVKNLGITIVSAGIVSIANSIGGLTAVNRGTISNCYVTGGELQCNILGGNAVGGLVGTNDATGTINNCYAQTNVTGSDGNIIGVFVGTNSNGGQINNCYAVGTPTPAPPIPGVPAKAGAIVGLSGSNAGSPASVVSNCYWDSTIYGTGTGVGNGDATGTTGKSTTDMKTQTTVDALNGTPSSGAWKLNSGGYPKLSWEQ